MGSEGDVGLVAEELDGLVQVASPDPGIADEGAAQGEQVVQVVGGVLGHAEGGELREEEVHLRRRLGAGGELELDLDAVEHLDLSGVGDVEGEDATITQSYDSAAGLARGELSPVTAFMTGKLKIAGNMGLILGLQGALAQLPAAMAKIEVEY